MRISDIIAKEILELIENQEGTAEIQRNELAGVIGCVPSQINYVITSRFTPEQGYIVESKRGGGGYIRITRVRADKRTAIMHIVNSIGDSINRTTARIFLENLAGRSLISNEAMRLIAAAISDFSLKQVPIELQDNVRAAILKQMLNATLIP